MLGDYSDFPGFRMEAAMEKKMFNGSCSFSTLTHGTVGWGESHFVCMIRKSSVATL